MFHPVGSQPPSVYWRRRLLLLGSGVLVIVLIVLLVSTLAGGDGKPVGAPTADPTPTVATAPGSTSQSPARTTPARSTSPSSGSSSVATPATCSLNNLQLTAKAGKQTYPAGAQPIVALQVVNTASVPCSRDLSDKQIVLRVYNGTSRVWGSHDCAVKSGAQVQTLAAGSPYLFQIQWTGLTSAPGCAKDSRQRVGAGSYTVYASLSGKNATAGQFQIN